MFLESKHYNRAVGAKTIVKYLFVSKSVVAANCRCQPRQVKRHGDPCFCTEPDRNTTKDEGRTRR